METPTVAEKETEQNKLEYASNKVKTMAHQTLFFLTKIQRMEREGINC